MSESYRVRVGQRHIAEATQQNARKCAIANAIKEQYGAVQVNVTAAFIKITTEETVDCYRTPPVARDLLQGFDRDRDSVAPVTFTLPAKAWVSSHPRRLQQAQKNEIVQRRKKVAKITGKKLSEVRPEDTEAFDDEGFAAVEVKPKVQNRKLPKNVIKERRSHRPVVSD